MSKTLLASTEAVDSVWTVLREQDAEDARYTALYAEEQRVREEDHPFGGYGVSDADSCASCGGSIIEWEHIDGYRVWTHVDVNAPLAGPDFARRACPGA